MVHGKSSMEPNPERERMCEKVKRSLEKFCVGWLGCLFTNRRMHMLKSEGKNNESNLQKKPISRPTVQNWLASQRNERGKGCATIKINLCSCINIWVSLPFSYFVVVSAAAAAVAVTSSYRILALLGLASWRYGHSFLPTNRHCHRYCEMYTHCVHGNM